MYYTLVCKYLEFIYWNQYSNWIKILRSIVKMRGMHLFCREWVSCSLFNLVQYIFNYVRIEFTLYLACKYQILNIKNGSTIIIYTFRTTCTNLIICIVLGSKYLILKYNIKLGILILIDYNLLHTHFIVRKYLNYNYQNVQFFTIIYRFSIQFNY